MEGLLSSLAVKHQLGALGVGGHMQPLQWALVKYTSLVRVQCVALVQLGCYAFAQELGELSGLMQGQLKGALAEGGAIELVKLTSHLGRLQPLLDRELGAQVPQVGAILYTLAGMWAANSPKWIC